MFPHIQCPSSPRAVSPYFPPSRLPYPQILSSPQILLLVFRLLSPKSQATQTLSSPQGGLPKFSPGFRLPYFPYFSSPVSPNSLPGAGSPYSLLSPVHAPHILSQEPGLPPSSAGLLPPSPVDSLSSPSSVGHRQLPGGRQRQGFNIGRQFLFSFFSVTTSQQTSSEDPKTETSALTH